MSIKKAFALRIDASMMKKIEKWAADEFRSVNGQIEWMLHKCLKEYIFSGSVHFIIFENSG